MIDIELIPVLSDNYSYVITSGDKVAVIDPGEAEPVIDYLESKKLKLDYILNTHHHGDHIGGNKALKEKYGAQIIGPEAERAKIPAMDIGLREQDAFEFGSEVAHIIETPGHTAGHICFYFTNSEALFSGDTLFSMGCGRLFEGSPADMYSSLARLKALPDDVMVYCGHEYTQANAEFCVTQEPDNIDLRQRQQEINELREAGKPTIPVSLGTEKKTNVFLRATDENEFAKIRSLKDNF